MFGASNYMFQGLACSSILKTLQGHHMLMLYVVALDDLLQDRLINDVTVNCFTSLLHKTNRFHADVCLFVNISQETSKCRKTTRDTLALRLVCHFFVLTTF